MIRIKKINLWQGVNAQGQNIQGKSDLLDADLLNTKLKNNGIVCLKQRLHYLFILESETKSETITQLLRQISVLLNFGIPLLKTLTLVTKTIEQAALRECLEHIILDISNGASIDQAFRAHKQYFNNLCCDLLAIGERSGNIARMFEQIATHQEKMLHLKQKLKKALTYPVIVLSVALLVFIALLLFVVPQFQTLFSGHNARLPSLTRMVIDLSQWVQHSIIWILAISISLILIFRRIKKTNLRFRLLCDHILLRLPFIGLFHHDAMLARFAQILSTLLNAGLPLLACLQTVTKTTHNLVYKNALTQVSAEVMKGETLNQALISTALFPEILINMVSIGEESGTLNAMLTNLARLYEGRLDRRFDHLSELIEPILMICLSVMIGTLIIAMYLPIFKLGAMI
jgi:type IV pilus assembly protein PilC